MDSDLSPLSFRRILPCGHTTSLRRLDEGVMRVSVEAGRLWLTQSGCADDHFIAAGEDLVLCGPGAVVVESDGAEMAVFTLSFEAFQAPSRSTRSASGSMACSGLVGAGG